MKNSVAALAMCLLLAGAALAGCGGGDSTTGDGGEIASQTGVEGNEGEAPGGGSADGNGSSGGESSNGESSSGGSSGGESSGGGGSSAGGGGEPAPSPGGSSGGEGSSGGGSQKGAGEAEVPASGPKADFVAEANALCEKQRKQIQAGADAIFKNPKGTGTQSQQAALRDLVDKAIVPGLEAEADGLQKLDPPPGDKGKIEALVAAIEAVIAEAQDDPAAFLANAGAFNETRKLARGYGVGPCGTLS